MMRDHPGQDQEALEGTNILSPHARFETDAQTMISSRCSALEKLSKQAHMLQALNPLQRIHSLLWRTG